MRHVCNKHKDHPDSLFKECAHDDDIEPRKWMKIGKYIFVIYYYGDTANLLKHFNNSFNRLICGWETF